MGSVVPVQDAWNIADQKMPPRATGTVQMDAGRVLTNRVSCYPVRKSQIRPVYSIVSLHMQLHYHLHLDEKVAAYIWIRWILQYTPTQHGGPRKVPWLLDLYICQSLNVAEAGVVVQTAGAVVARPAMALVPKITPERRHISARHNSVSIS